MATDAERKSLGKSIRKIRAQGAADELGGTVELTTDGEPVVVLPPGHKSGELRPENPHPAHRGRVGGTRNGV